MTANEPYRLEEIIARVSQAFDLGSRNGPYRPEIQNLLAETSQKLDDFPRGEKKTPSRSADCRRVLP
jgi:hypothetical protein